MSKIVPPGVVCPPASAIATMWMRMSTMRRIGAKRAIGDFMFFFCSKGGVIAAGPRFRYRARRVCVCVCVCEVGKV